MRNNIEHLMFLLTKLLKLQILTKNLNINRLLLNKTYGKSHVIINDTKTNTKVFTRQDVNLRRNSF